MLHYEIKGHQEENLVLLHGFMENSEMWDKMEEKLIENFRLILIDLPGHGKSDDCIETNTMEWMSEMVNETLDAINIPIFHLLGHSMGGYVALAYAEAYPYKLKSLGLFFSNFLEDDPEKKNIREKSLRVIQENFPAYANAGIHNLFAERDRELLRSEIEMAEKMALETPINGVLASVRGMIVRKDRSQVLQLFQDKVLLILGKYDNAMPLDKILHHIPPNSNISCYILPCGHMGHLEKPDICSQIIVSELLSAKIQDLN